MEYVISTTGGRVCVAARDSRINVMISGGAVAYLTGSEAAELLRALKYALAEVGIAV